MKVNNINKFIEKSNEIHKHHYNYDKSIYNGNKVKLTITCNLHGDFEQNPHNHLSGRGCRECANDRLRNIFSKSETKYINEANIIHSNFYNYSKTKYINNRTNIDIICPIHGVFSQNPKHHLNYVGCPICKSSKGEKRISSYLNLIGITYIHQHTFDKCLGKKKKLPFDFYLPEYNLCIEFDGIQHYSDKHFRFRTNGKIEIDKFKNRIINDTKKNIFCSEHNISLLRIKYTDYKNIEEILKYQLL